MSRIVEELVQRERKEAAEKAAEATALHLLKSGKLSLEEIAGASRMTVEEVKRLQTAL